MTSQISIRNFIKQEISQNGWMFGLTGLLHLLTGPVVFLLSTSQYKNWTNDTAANRYYNFFTDSYFLWQLFAMIGCLCIGIFIYRYLFSKRMVDLYHSVPISRSKLFLCKYLQGFLIWFLPFLINTGSILLFYTIRSAGNSYFTAGLGAFIKVVLLLLFSFFIFYHLFLTAVYLSGNVINMMANTAIIGSSVIGIAAILYVCADGYFNTFCYTPSNLLCDILFGFSPLTVPFALCSFTSTNTLSLHIPLLLISAVICVGLLAISHILCMKRPSELAEGGTRSEYYIIPSRIAASFLLGVAGACFFSNISTSDQQLAWGIFGALLSCIVTFGILNSIYQTTIKAFFKHRVQLLLTALISILTITAFQLDWFGYDAYLPAKNELNGIAIYSSQFSDGSSYYDIVQTSNGPALQTPSGTSQKNVTQTKLYTDIDNCYDLLNTFVNDTSESGYSYSTFYAKIQLKNGKTYERRYRICDENYKKLEPFIESEDYIASNYKFSTGALGYPQSLTLELMNTSVQINTQKNDLAESEIKEIMDAYYADFKEHFSLEQEASNLTVFSFSGQHTDNGYNYFSLSVPLEYERTLRVVEKLYPEHPLTIESADECTDLFINTDYFNKSGSASETVDALYEYFGYPISQQQEKINAETTVPSKTTVSAEPIPTAISEFYFELNITDTALLEELFPLLYFGHYSDLFDKKEFIYVGHMRTIKGISFDCYIRPGTMPKNIIAEIYESKKILSY